MSFYHGVKVEKVPASISTPIVVDSGIHFIVGTAPVHMVNGLVNEPILAYSYAEAVSKMGFTDEFEKYDICEEIYTAFVLYGIAPIVMVNVLDPKKHRISDVKKETTFIDDKVDLELEAIMDTVKVLNSTGVEYQRGNDYDMLYTEGVLRLERLENGSIKKQEKVQVIYDAVDPEKVTKADIIGGYDTVTKSKKGFELINSVFPKYRIVPTILLAPRFSHDSEVAAVMATKCENINGIFKAKAIIDVDTKIVTEYTEVPKWKNDNNITQKTQILVYPMCALGGKKYHYSVHLAASMTLTDMKEEFGNGSPCESASNKKLKIDSFVSVDGKEILLDLTEANYLNSQGIVTGINMMGGYVSWGNTSACYPSNTDPTDYFYNVSRMFDFVGNSIILAMWEQVDKNITIVLLEFITQNMNMWLNTLMAEGKILGGRVEIKEEDNPEQNLAAGKALFRVYLTPPSPAQELKFKLEYDKTYLANILK